MKKKGILLFLLLTVLLSSCGRDYFAKKLQDFVKDKSSIPAQNIAESAPPPMPSPAPMEAPVPETNKVSTSLEEINTYIQCLNRTAERVKQSRDRYLSWVNEKSGPTCKESYISYGLYTLYNDGVEVCQKAAQKGQPGSPMQKSATDLAAAYAELVPLVQKAEDYYTQQDYKDDHCEKAKAMHPQLLSAFSRYLQAKNNLETAIGSVKGDLDQQELVQIEQAHGKKLPWYTKSFMISAEKLIKSFPTNARASLSDVNYLSDYPNVEKSYEALAQYSLANPQEGKDTFWYSSFESSAKEFYTKAKFLKRDLAEGKKADVSSMNEVIEAYNRLVRDSNNLKFKM